MMANALRAGFHRFIQRSWPDPVGSSERTTRYKHFMAACSLGKCPRARVARRNLAFKLSMAFVSGMKWGRLVRSVAGGRRFLVVGFGVLRRNS